MDFKIRQADLNDFLIIQDLNHKLFVEEKNSGHDDQLLADWPYSKIGEVYYKKALTDPEYQTLIAYNDDLILGYVIGTSANKYSYRKVRTGELDNIYIIPDFRRSGVGQALVDHLLVWLKTKGVKRVMVCAYAKNESAISFYDTVGFSLDSVNLETEI
jgi:ribosomal protein S18 acetylase RimI-like enzyme